MAKSEVALSKRVIQGWQPAPDDPFLWDASVPGFGVRRNANGTTTALLGYRNKYNQRRRYKLGVLGDSYTINQARKDAAQWITDIRRGADPLGEQRSTRNALSVGELLDLYLESAKFASKADSTRYMDKSRIRRHLRPLLDKTKVEAMTRDTVRRFFRDITAGKTAVVEKMGKRAKARVKGGEAVARSSVKLLSAVFSWAIAEGLAKENPCDGVEIGSNGVREAILETPDQYKLLFDALDRMQYSNIDPDNPGDVYVIPDAAANAIRVLAFTGARLSEITEARWSWVNLEQGTITVPPKSHKSGHRTGKPKIIPLPSPARSVIASLPRGEPDDLVFPATRGTGAINLSSKMWVQIRKEAGLPDGITNHSLRHSIGTMLAVQGAEAAQIMAALGHSQLSTTQRYIHIARDARAEMMERYTAGIAAAVAPKADVVPIKRANK